MFTAGIGENRPELREAICAKLDQLGIVLDPAKNAATKAQEARDQRGRIRACKVLVIPTNEELVVAREVKRFLESEQFVSSKLKFDRTQNFIIMAHQAIGLIETRGLVALVEGTDAMLKAANVELVGPMTQVGNALVTAVVVGDVAAVKAATDAGAQAIKAIKGEVVSVHVIARPHADVEAVLPKKPLEQLSAWSGESRNATRVPSQALSRAVTTQHCHVPRKS